MKQCAKCNISKDFLSFPNHKKTKDGKCSWCRSCHTERSKQYREDHPDRILETSRKSRSLPAQKEKAAAREKLNKKTRSKQSRFRTIERKYGLKEAEYNTLLEDQDRKCKLCYLVETDNTFGYLYVDHCHKTGKIRGLLCHSCNSMLGYAKDDITVLTKAIEYLRENNGEA